MYCRSVRQRSGVSLRPRSGRHGRLWSHLDILCRVEGLRVGDARLEENARKGVLEDAEEGFILVDL
jgi:hypothetical protein